MNPVIFMYRACASKSRIRRRERRLFNFVKFPYIPPRSYNDSFVRSPHPIDSKRKLFTPSPRPPPCPLLLLIMSLDCKPTVPALSRSNSLEGGPTETATPRAILPQLKRDLFAFGETVNFGGDSSRDAETEHAFAALTAWRSAYRVHRRGGAHGASGELSDLADALPDRAFYLTPAIQRARLARRLSQSGASPTKKGASAAPTSPSRALSRALSLEERAQAERAPRLHVHVGAGKVRRE
jgi:hypothetical protein